ncbi:MAG: hypothetical protein J6V23_07005 [Bacteroidaceae bacterium]|nr:hypothetical protein [Bacteroidaceae bacterium]
MTDNEIIKALECCQKAKLNIDCVDLKCPFATEYGCNIGIENLRNDALDLINRQKAEIERLQNERIESIRELTREVYDTEIAEAKFEAIKEFAERLKSLQIGLEISGESLYYVPIDCIDNLVKEIIGE